MLGSSLFLENIITIIISRRGMHTKPCSFRMKLVETAGDVSEEILYKYKGKLERNLCT
jgi:hypothetical protein